MIANLYADESPAARMLDLIARKAPLLMRVGGGALAQEKDVCRATPHAMSPHKRARAIVARHRSRTHRKILGDRYRAHGRVNAVGSFQSVGARRHQSSGWARG
jgi:hypothetical protein